MDNEVLIVNTITTETIDSGIYSFVGAPVDFLTAIQTDDCWACGGIIGNLKLKPRWAGNLEDLMISMFGPSIAASSLIDLAPDILKITGTDAGWEVELFEDLIRGQKPAHGSTLKEVADRVEMRVQYYESTREE